MKEYRLELLLKRREILEYLLKRILKEDGKELLTKGGLGLCDFIIMHHEWKHNEMLEALTIFKDLLNEHFKTKRRFYTYNNYAELHVTYTDDNKEKENYYYWKPRNYKSRLAFVKKQFAKVKKEIKEY